MIQRVRPGRPLTPAPLPARLLRGRTVFDERTGFQTTEDRLGPDDYGVLTDNRFGQADVREPGEKD